MKLADMTPDLATYHALLYAAASSGLWLEAWAIFDDMVLLGLKPSIVTFNHLIHAQRHRPSSYLWNTVNKMTQAGIAPNSATFSMIIHRFASDSNLELALQWLLGAKSSRIIPDLQSAQSVIVLAARQGYPRLALELATWFQSQSPEALGCHTWSQCLVASAENLYAEGVLFCWNVVVHELKIYPDQGLCTLVLNTASRHGLPALASSALDILRLLGVQLQEHHFAALVEAHCNSGDLENAFEILSEMRYKGLEPTTETTLPLLQRITKDLDTLDASWAILDSMHKNRKAIDISALHVLMHASISLGDLQRAVGTYKCCADYGIQPDIQTFNLLLSGCVMAHHRELGDHLLAVLKAQKIRPDFVTYETMIELCLTQKTYEDAFFYLEEMKAAGFKPSARTYEAIIRRCLMADDIRWQVAMNEMVEQDYDVPRSIRGNGSNRRVHSSRS
ncbi:hypothetical protein AX16_005232 [Volvariella volvacea WC 439]|nr:hypothetical protein AX16_005232 [Volvariella volvacea WC 439]